MSKVPFFKRGWFWGLIAVIIFSAVVSANKNQNSEDANVAESSKEITAADVVWQEWIPEKDRAFFLAAVNKLVVENERCAQKIDLSVIAPPTGTADNPQYSVMCGEKNEARVVYFTKAEIESGKKLEDPKHLSEGEVMTQCQLWVNNNVPNGRTAKFDWWTKNVKQKVNGLTMIRADFEVTNAFGGKEFFNASCQVAHDGSTTGNVIPKK